MAQIPGFLLKKLIGCSAEGLPVHHLDSKRLPYTCKQLFTLVADIEQYPAFLPGWSQARLLYADNFHLEVEQQLQAGPLTLRFHSTAQLEDCQRILITSQDAPFGQITIDWHFTPLAEDHCEVSVEIALVLHAGPLTRPLSRLVGRHGDQLLQLFERRAQVLYAGN